MKKWVVLISLGVINILHAMTHLMHFIQSIFLFSASVSDEHSHINHILHNPYFSIVWAVVGLFTLYIGIKDYRHHKKCEN
jgi:ABC-type long-subunit fatty acid transport system fused permease/ATPase subunit